MIARKINVDQKALRALRRKAEDAARRAIKAQASQIAAKAGEQLAACSAAYHLRRGRDAA